LRAVITNQGFGPSRSLIGVNAQACAGPHPFIGLVRFFAEDTMTTMIDLARQFLQRKRIAVIGVERAELGFSRVIFRELVKRGYDAVPVNPAMTTVEGRPCSPRVQAIEPAVEAALIMTSAAQSAQVTQDCVAAGIRSIWFHRGTGPGSASPEALAICREHHLQPITNLCPYMALPNAGWFHGVHTFMRGSARRPLERNAASASQSANCDDAQRISATRPDALSSHRSRTPGR
jgi:uncharacterized protein